MKIVCCMCFPDVPIKNIGAHNVYIEYTIEIQGSKNDRPILLNTTLQDMRIFKGMPPSIEQRIGEVKKIISDYSSLN